MTIHRMILLVAIALWAPLRLAYGDAVAGPGRTGPALQITADPGLSCRRAVEAAGRAARVPDHLMSAIARVESGRRGPDGQVNPWPWSINVEGVDHIFDTRDAAIASVRALQAGGHRSIDVGCMQVNLLHHPNAFATLEQAFDPAVNAAYAAKFLTQLFEQTGSWVRATASYHSANPELGDPYQRKVASVLAEETGKDQAMLAAAPGAIPRLPGLSPGMAAGGGALMLGNRSESARIIPLAGASMARGLDAYRSAPVRIAAGGN